MEGKKFDGEKPRLHLLPPKALVEVGKVLTFGAQKYDEQNWRKLDRLQERYTGAALRHIFSHMDGERWDNETGYSHLAHAICCLLFKLEIETEEQIKAEAEELLAKITEDEWYGAWCEEEGRRESQRQQYQESYTITFGGVADYEKTSVRDAKYSVQYNPLGQDHRGIPREEGVCKTPQEPASWQASLEYRDSRDGNFLSERRELSRHFEGYVSQPSIREIRDRASWYSI